MGITSMWSGCWGCARCLFNPTDPSLTEQCEGAPTSRHSSSVCGLPGVTSGCILGDDGDESGDGESGSPFLRKPPTFTLSSLPLLLLLLCVSIKRTSMQISPGEDKIPVSTPASVRRHSFALLVIALSLVGDTCDPLRVLIAGCNLAVNHCAGAYSGNKGDNSTQYTRQHQIQSLFIYLLN